MSNLIVTTLLLAVSHSLAAADDRHDIGRSFYIPDTDMLDGHTGGYKILQSNMEGCIHEVGDSKIKKNFLFYEDEQSFFNSLGSEVSIGGKLTNAFTMGVTLSATSNGMSASDTSIKGATLDIASYNREVYVDVGCIYGSELAKEVKTQFELLPKTIDKPDQKNSWVAYDSFLKTYGSHLVQKAYFGSRMSQYIFTKHTKEYSSREYKVKACEKLEGVANIGKFGISSCQGFTKDDTKAVEHMEVNSKLIIKGGTDKTRAALSTKRTKDLIEKFLNEADKGTLPIRYSYIAIWTLLKSIYLHTEHLAKAVNLENYYKGYLNFGCPRQTINGLVVQKFQLGSQHYKLPTYECALTPTGCHQDDDCHRHFNQWCECRGNTCIKYKQEFDYHTGTNRLVPYAFTNPGWYDQGCVKVSLLGKCACNEPNTNWKVIWKSDDESFISLIAFSRLLESGKARKEEL